MTSAFQAHPWMGEGPYLGHRQCLPFPEGSEEVGVLCIWSPDACGEQSGYCVTVVITGSSWLPQSQPLFLHHAVPLSPSGPQSLCPVLGLHCILFTIGPCPSSQLMLSAAHVFCCWHSPSSSVLTCGLSLSVVSFCLL